MIFILPNDLDFREVSYRYTYLSIGGSKLRKVIFSIGMIVLMVSMSVKAEEPSSKQLKEFAVAIGMYDQIQEQLMGVKQQGEQAAQQYAQQIVASVPGLPQEFGESIQAEYIEFMHKIDAMFDTEKMVNIYLELISKELSAREIQELTEFYNSELGKKFTEANTAVMKEWALRAMDGFDEKMMAQLEAFGSNLMAKAESYAEQQ